jgi:hypothetical protein
MSTTAEPRPNRYADDCAACDEWVAPGAGHLYNIDGNWVVTCDTCEPPSIVPTAPNNRDGACETCGVWVPAGAGAWMGARGVQCARHAAMDAYDAQRDYEAAEQRCRNADHQRTATYAALRHAVRLPANPAEYDAWTPAGRARAAEHAAVVAERAAVAAANNGIVCTRCGGAGGHASWPGYTCFDCGGRGWVEA